MSRGSGWRWSFVPRWLLDAEAFLTLEHDRADLLFRLYLTCDPHGRFQAGARSLQRMTGIFRTDLPDVLQCLSPDFVTLYDVDAVKYGQINGYDEDAPADLIRKRSPSVHPSADARQTLGRRKADTVGRDKRDKQERIEEEKQDPTDRAGSSRARARVAILDEVIA